MKRIILIILLFIPLFCFNSVAEVNLESYFNDLKVKKEEEIKNNIIESIIQIESESDSFAINGDNLGILQIRPIMVYEVNRILGYKKYRLKDRFDPIKSIEMFKIYTNHHTPDWNLELVARRWNGGYNGELKLSTLNYYLKIKSKNTL